MTSSFPNFKNKSLIFSEIKEFSSSDEDSFMQSFHHEPTNKIQIKIKQKKNNKLKEEVGSGEEGEEEEEEEEQEQQQQEQYDSDCEEYDPFISNSNNDYSNCIKEFEKNTFRKKVRGMALFEFISAFTYLFISPHYWWIILTSVPSLYIFFIIPRNINSYKNYEQKYQIIYQFNKHIQKKKINYFHRWNLINALIRIIFAIIIPIQYKYQFFSLQVFYLIQMIIYPLLNSYYAYNLEFQYNRNIFI